MAYILFKLLETAICKSLQKKGVNIVQWCALWICRNELLKTRVQAGHCQKMSKVLKFIAKKLINTFLSNFPESPNKDWLTAADNGEMISSLISCSNDK